MTKINPKFIGPQQNTPVIHGPQRHLPKGFDTFRRDVLVLIAFDPGQMTGWSLIVLPRKLDGKDIFSSNFETLLFNRHQWDHGQIDCLDEDLGAYKMMKLVERWPGAAVLVEDFILRMDRRERSRNLLSPVRLTAKLEHYLWRCGRKMLLQQPSMAKTTVTDERMKIWNVYQPGQPHARDADRHILTFIRRCYGPQGITMRQIAWPYAYGPTKEKVNGGIWHHANGKIGE